MRRPTTRVHDQRWTDREFRRIIRRLRLTSPAVHHWRTGPSQATDVLLTPHRDGRCAPSVAAAAGSLAIALTAILTGRLALALTVTLVGAAVCVLLGSDQARTSLTVTEDGRVEVGNGVHRRLTTVPAVAVARIRVASRPRSRWDPRRACGELALHNGERVPVRALAFDPASELDHRRAVYLARRAVEACQDAGAALETRRVETRPL